MLTMEACANYITVYAESLSIEFTIISVWKQKHMIGPILPPGGYFGIKRLGMTVGNPRKLP